MKGTIKFLLDNKVSCQRIYQNAAHRELIIHGYCKPYDYIEISPLLEGQTIEDLVTVAEPKSMVIWNRELKKAERVTYFA